MSGPNNPRALPVIILAGRPWILDRRLGEARAQDNPSERMTADQFRVLVELQEDGIRKRAAELLASEPLQVNAETCPECGADVLSGCFLGCSRKDGPR